MVINTNISSVRTANLMKASVRRLNESVARLSSGSRIINPADDAAGLAVTTKFTTKTHRIDAVRNSLANTLSFVQTADGYLQKVAKALTRMGELAALAKDGTKTDTDLANYNLEFQELKEFVRDMQDRSMNGQSLLKGGNISVLNDANGQSFSFSNSDLTSTTMSVAVDGAVFSPPPFTWTTSIDTWTTSKAGSVLDEDAYKITEPYFTFKDTMKVKVWHLKQDVWYSDASGFSATNNGGTKYDSGSFVKQANVAGHPNIIYDLVGQLGAGAADEYTNANFISKTNPTSVGNGNIEAADLNSHAANTFSKIDPSGMASSLAPAYTAYAKGSFTTGDVTGINATTVSAGAVVSVNPIATNEDTAATFVAAGGTVTSDPTGVDAGAIETSQSHVLTDSGAKWAIQKVKDALEQLSTDRASLGTVMARIGRTNDQLAVLRENLDQAISRIRDTNVAAESTRFARHQILTNSSTDMLRHANIVPEHALRLILNL
tara:strand:- start:438 stop:1907 length:1470 start_codon:yes stop_codon:yes gene_type:complete